MAESASSDVVVNTLKTLAIDAVQKANSGHPGLPMGMADAASVLWCDFLTVDPAEPGFVDRDRFVLSAGHGSMLLYGLLHLAGFDLSLEEIGKFRQLHSKTPGHPEVGITAGVETTTGPLGQGFANAVGMAMAEAHLRARFNRGGFEVVDHFTYGICSDGDLEEGVSAEAASLAGHLGLGRIVMIYDDNKITIDGGTEIAFTESVTGRFEAYGWHVLSCDGHDRAAVADAIRAGKADTQRPTLIAARTIIGHGSPNKEGKSAAHGSPLGAEEIRLTKEAIGWPVDSTLLVPTEAVTAFDSMRARGALKRTRHEAMMTRYAMEYPALAEDFARITTGDGLDPNLRALLPDFTDGKPQATRASSGKVLNAIATGVSQLWGGSADLAGSNKTRLESEGDFSATERTGRNIHFGIREHGMAAIMNGMALHGGIIPYGGTFLTFSDYMRGAIRLAALMEQRVIYVLTHDSIFLGEDGPTHQSVEHAMALRLIPNLRVMRPADGNETAAAWFAALKHTKGPTALLLTRQNLPQLSTLDAAIDGVEHGGYVLVEGGNKPDVVLIGTGSETHLCIDAAKTLAAEGISARVVSVPCLDRFLAQPADYRATVIPPECKARVSVEAGRTWGWRDIVGDAGAMVGLDRFGESAPAEVLAELFGFTADNVAKVARETLSKVRATS
ncbi:MAG: transketolase [Myxococcota bacterium]|jgi:transketolase